ncbi:hypothetical protein BC629DRAFT_1551424 [Irpex lacteus]|nr:hypothetical protein BC629DRAFT_1551424 [Irpex lacteus]
MDDHIDVAVIQSAYRLFRDLNKQLRDYEPILVEELDMQKNVQHDLKILAAADALQADDHLLRTTITSALEQSEANWVQLIEFAVQVVGNRVPLVDSDINPKHIYKVYGRLSPAVQEVVNNIFTAHIAVKLAETSTGIVAFPKNWGATAWWAFNIYTIIPNPSSPFLPLHLEPEQMDRMATTPQVDATKRWYFEERRICTIAAYVSVGFANQ